MPINYSSLSPAPLLSIKANLMQNNNNSINNYRQHIPNDLIRSHHGKSLSLMENKNFVGKIGWGMERPVLNESPRRVVLED